VPCQNIDWLPLPTQLWNALKFYQQNIQPILMQGRTGTIQSCCCALWVNAVCTLTLSLSLSILLPLMCIVLLSYIHHTLWCGVFKSSSLM
jgi:hypothetical protein